MNEEYFQWGTPNWLPAVLFVLLAVAIVVIWAYLRRRQMQGLTVVCGLLKLAAFLGLAACLLEPTFLGERPKPHANIAAMLVDTSQSMTVNSAGTETPRAERLTKLLEKDTAWQQRLEQDFDVRRYAFDTQLRNVTNVDELTFEGIATSLSASLETLKLRLKGRPVAGMLLFTDGNESAVNNLSVVDFPFPIYPVVDTETASIPDLRWGDVSVSVSDFESAPVSLAAKIEGDVGRDGHVLVRLFDGDDSLVEEQRLDSPRDQRPTNVHFQFRPKEFGVRFYKLTVADELDDLDFSTGKTYVEATLANNIHRFVVQRRHGPYRVLYLAGRPNWEFKFLRRAIQEDPELKLVGLLRIAKKEAKFSFRDRGGVGTNSLFAGLGNSEEEAAEQYDEPVLVRLGVEDADELRSGFPKTGEALFAYDAIILDDIESDFFSEDQLLLLRRYVSARGGGLLFLGGQESLDSQQDAKTPLGELSPVYLRSSQLPESPLRIELTREGWLQPWLRLRATQQQEQERLKRMPAFEVVNHVGEVKPGASLLVTGRGADNAAQSVLVSQRFGRGRTTALLIGDLWRWGLQRDDPSQNDLAQGWRQLIRYVVSDVPRRVELTITCIDDPMRPAQLQMLVRDREFLPFEQASLSLKITSPGGKTFDLTPTADEQRSGHYHAEYWGREEGGYRADLVVTESDGSEIGRDAVGWVSQPAAQEFKQLSLNRSLLATLAERTGGRVIEYAELPKFVSNWPAEKVPIREKWEYPLWHRPWVLLATIGCLCLEWGLRRWKGMP